MAEEDKGGGVVEAETKVKKKTKGIISRIWNGIFRQSRDDFEKRLQYLSKEEAAVHARLQRRSLSRRLMTRRLIFFSVFLEVIAVGYAIVTTRSLDLNWKMRAFRVLPMFLLPGLSALFYSAFVNFIGLCERKDQKTLERLQAERQAKIDELKERTNYYTTQQLIQRYDPDPAAKAAAATVLASKLGSDSGLKVYVGDESKLNAPTGKSNDVEFVQASGLRNRKQHTRSSSAGSSPMHVLEQEMPHSMQSDGPMISEHRQLVEHENPQAYAANDGGWIARLAALLVGEDPMQSYALICGNCHMHNGLARKEDYSYITYYCPHCHALNQPKQLQERVPGSNSNLSTVVTGSGVETSNKNANVSPIDSTQSSSSPVATGSEIGEPTEMAASRDLPS